jgi:hypothetical protein
MGNKNYKISFNLVSGRRKLTSRNTEQYIKLGKVSVLGYCLRLI